MDAALGNLMNAIRRPMNTLSRDNALAGLEKLEAVLCKNFDEMMTKSNSVAATYHTLMRRHAACERLKKELTASGNSNTVSNKVQLLQNVNAQIEQDMVQLEDVQCLVWKGTQETHFVHKEIFEMIEVLKRLQKANNGTPNPEVNEIEGKSGSGPSQAR